jgi:hypothetical protein
MAVISGGKWRYCGEQTPAEANIFWQAPVLPSYLLLILASLWRPGLLVGLPARQARTPLI